VQVQAGDVAGVAVLVAGEGVERVRSAVVDQLRRLEGDVGDRTRGIVPGILGDDVGRSLVLGEVRRVC